MSFLPRTADGRVDDRALLKCPVLDSDLVSRWENELEDVLDTGYAVAVRERIREPLSL